MEDRIAALLDDLTLAEKVSLVHGASDPAERATGYIPGVERLDIPPLRMVDGPLGVRIPGEESTAFPAPLALAATFDTDLARAFGEALGRETRGKDQDVLLAPGVNLLRVPHNGRNFEYLSEDPVHAAAVSQRLVAGIQSMDVIATPKHYVANNQETDRPSIDVQVSERTLRELYLPAFEAAVEAGAGSVMTAYNRVNGTRMSDHRRLLRDVLKDEWGFAGFTVSDWWGSNEAAPAANGGLDVEMPGIPMDAMPSLLEEEEADEKATEADTDEADIELGEQMDRGMPVGERIEHFANHLEAAVRAGEVSESRLDDMVARVLGQMDRIGLFDGDRAEGAVDTPAHRNLATRVATRGTVLLENDGVLPLSDDTDVAIIGPNIETPILGGGGSSETTPVVETAPLAGIEDRAEGTVTVAHGLPRIEGISLIDFATGNVGTGETEREPDLEGAADAAAAADVAVVFVRDTNSEAVDRSDLALPERQDELVEAVAAANDDTVVVCNTGGPIEMPWREDVAAIVENWYPGQAHGEAVAAVLYGDADPAGRLPVTFAPEEAYPTAEDRRFPGVEGEVHYDEGVFVGYRHFDRAEAKPTYPFGHGQSYAAFEYVEASVDDGTATVTVENTAERDGRDVVQAYIRPPAVDGVDRPARELAGFAAVEIPAGERVSVEFDLDERAFARYDETEGWTVDPGEYVVEIGRSARDSRLDVAVQR